MALMYVHPNMWLIEGDKSEERQRIGFTGRRNSTDCVQC